MEDKGASSYEPQSDAAQAAYDANEIAAASVGSIGVSAPPRDSPPAGKTDIANAPPLNRSPATSMAGGSGAPWGAQAGVGAAGQQAARPGPVAQLASHTLTLVIGVFGAAVLLVVAALYSLAHVFGRIAGITNDSSHFFIGLGLAVLAFVGALLTMGKPVAGAVLMAAAAILFFAIVGWWAVLSAPFLLWAAYLSYRHRDG